MLPTKQESKKAFQNAKRRAKRYGINTEKAGWLWMLTLDIALRRGYTGLRTNAYWR